MLIKPSSCSGCALQTLGQGFMQVDGSGRNGVLLVGEALGQAEAEMGLPFQGKAGQALDKMLMRGGMNRDDFRIANVLWCRPPSNKLANEWYEEEAINFCSPNLDRAIREFAPKCIVALGVTAFRRLLPEVASQRGVGLLDSKKAKGARGYVFWSQLYGCWVIPTVHPSFIARGKTAFAQVLIHDIQRATEIARDGYAYIEGDYLLDPPPMQALLWTEEWERAYEADPELFLSCDIETPDKGDDEEELDLEERSDYTIFRCSYSYKDYHGMSIPWDGPYRIVHERLLAHPCNKVFHNAPFDVPRILAA